MIRCDTCANSEHCNEIVSSNSMCFLYICNLNFSVGQTVYFANWEQGSSGFCCKCISSKIVDVTSSYIEVKDKYRRLVFELSDYGKFFFLNKEDLYSVFVDCERN